MLRVLFRWVDNDVAKQGLERRCLPLLFYELLQVRTPFVQIAVKDFVVSTLFQLFGRFEVMCALIVIRFVADLDLRIERPVSPARLLDRIAKLRVGDSSFLLELLHHYGTTEWNGARQATVPVYVILLLILLDEPIGHLHRVK